MSRCQLDGYPMSILDTKLRNIYMRMYVDLQNTYKILLSPIRNTYRCTVLWYNNINTKYELSLLIFF